VMQPSYLLSLFIGHFRPQVAVTTVNGRNPYKAQAPLVSKFAVIG
jgi:hypothetical protein